MVGACIHVFCVLDCAPEEINAPEPIAIEPATVRNHREGLADVSRLEALLPSLPENGILFFSGSDIFLSSCCGRFDLLSRASQSP